MNLDIKLARFVADLMPLVGGQDELTFERRILADGSYEFHGRIVGLSGGNTLLHILRTRTHAGEVHTMNVFSFLRIKRPDGQALENHHSIERLATAAERSARRAQNLRCIDRDPSTSGSSDRNCFSPRGDARDAGLPSHRVFMFSSWSPSDSAIGREAGITGATVADATIFMRVQSHFPDLNVAVSLALHSGIVWPVGVQALHGGALDSAVRWLDVCAAFEGVPYQALHVYVRRVRANKGKAVSVAGMEAEWWPSLRRAGLMVWPIDPTNLEGLLARLDMAALRRIHALNMQGAGPVNTKKVLIKAILKSATPTIEEAALTAAQATLTPRIGPPPGMSMVEVHALFEEQATLLFFHRNWLWSGGEDLRESDFMQRVAQLQGVCL